MNIDLLVNYPEHIEDIAKLVYKEFVVPTSSKKTYEEVVDFFKETYANELPITFIANVDGQCVGTVSVFENDWKERPQYKPWLASFNASYLSAFQQKNCCSRRVTFVKII
ncbi:hypothetical protein [Lysinibacillus sp. RS5]|uniref:hypothetical protein n=1 Tax=unclassified Lysinibacillus TaxID=2636778 RepID=UPI0035BE4B54